MFFTIKLVNFNSIIKRGRLDFVYMYISKEKFKNNKAHNSKEIDIKSKKHKLRT